MCYTLDSGCYPDGTYDMEIVIVIRDLLEIHVMNFAQKERLEFLQIVMVTFSFNLKELKALW